MAETPPWDGSTIRPAVTRRAFVGSVGTATIAALAGCGNGDGGDADSNGRSTPEQAVSPTEVRGVDRYETAVVLPLTTTTHDFQYQRYGTLNPSGLNDIFSFHLANRSFGDNAVYGELVDDWSYDSGALEITLHDDFRYWDGDPVDADNVLLHMELEEYFLSTQDVDAHPAIDDTERTGDYSIRFTLAEDWREEYALERSIVDWGPKGSEAYYGEWLQEFEDAANDEEIVDVARNLVQTGEGNPDPFYNAPFRITDVHETRIVSELRLEEDPVPHYVDDINFTELVVRIIDPNQRGGEQELFKQQWSPAVSVDETDVSAVGFETARADFPLPSGPWSIVFNCSEPPTANARFRRAVTYMADRERLHQDSNVIPNERHTPFGTPAREETYVSDDVLTALEDFGWDEVAEEAATREMEAGGFERDSEGQWLRQEGSRAGEPIEVTVLASPAHTAITDRARPFRSALQGWGLDVTIRSSRDYQNLLQDDSGYTLAVTNWGGVLPERVMGENFPTGRGDAAGSPRLPASIEAPPVGEPWPTADDLETYDVGSMTESLQTTRDEAEYGELVDRLTWVFNQTSPRIGVETLARGHVFNTNRFDVALPADAPDLWTRAPPDRVATTGAVEYVPPDER